MCQTAYNLEGDASSCYRLFHIVWAAQNVLCKYLVFCTVDMETWLVTQAAALQATYSLWIQASYL